MFWMYNLFLSALMLLGLPVLGILCLLRQRVRAGLRQRFGWYPRGIRETLQGTRPIWIHAASVGEVLSSRALVEELKAGAPGKKILVSTFTATGYETALRALSGADAVIYFPLDHPWPVRRALRLFSPSVVVFLETEIWPNFLRSACRKGIPTFLLSGRVSARAFRRYLVFRRFFARVLDCFTAVGMQSEADAERLRAIGIAPEKVSVAGSLKHAGVLGDSGDRRGSVWRAGEGKVLVAGSTHRGEEAILLDVFEGLKRRFPRLSMVLAPRHPERFPEVERLLQKKQLSYERKSRMNGGEGEAPEILFLDTLGDLASFYSAADVAFVGGSLVEVGGHNPLEPARFRKPVLFGPYMSNFSAVVEALKRSGGGIEVKGREDLIREVADLFSDPMRAARVGNQAYGAVVASRDVVKRSIELMVPYMPGD